MKNNKFLTDLEQIHQREIENLTSLEDLQESRFSTDLEMIHQKQLKVISDIEKLAEKAKGDISE